MPKEQIRTGGEPSGNSMNSLEKFKKDARESLNAAIKDGSLDRFLDSMDEYALGLQLSDFGGDPEYFRGFRAGITHIVDALTDVAIKTKAQKD